MPVSIGSAPSLPVRRRSGTASERRLSRAPPLNSTTGVRMRCPMSPPPPPAPAPLPSPSSPQRPVQHVGSAAPPPPPPAGAAGMSASVGSLPRPRSVYESAAASLRSALEQSLMLLTELHEAEASAGATTPDMEVAEAKDALNMSIASVAHRLSTSVAVPASVRSQAGSVAGWVGAGAGSVAGSVSGAQSVTVTATPRPGVLSIGLAGGVAAPSPGAFAGRPAGDMALDASVSTVGGASSSAAPPLPPSVGPSVEVDVAALLDRYSSMLADAVAQKMSARQ
uniref:Uncharacterized protein n=1 Tax=Bicosoecida sp. CB-2014 TaxID=1486930 RepID=A0A7S1G993_9STRA|mmetsp:Transcript_25892/g.90154  ORF Transcript_25892/g.90154 Transcript_25892/m.90154 type:complete len:281 (+) Transcript_25892:557-1399(+)